MTPTQTWEFLKARGYQSTLDILETIGPWEPTIKGNMRMRILDLPGEGDMIQGLRDIEQCDWVGLALDCFSSRMGSCLGRDPVV
jgi:hypothetical protein